MMLPKAIANSFKAVLDTAVHIHYVWLSFAQV